MIERLPVVMPPGQPREAIGGADSPMRAVTRQVAFQPERWTPERRAKVTALFDGLAPEWHTRLADPDRHAPLRDALARGGPFTPGKCLECGSGTGDATGSLAERFGFVIAVDLAMAMLRLAPASPGARVRADAGQLPLPDGSIDTVVLQNALLFPAEVSRILTSVGAVIWVNTAGDDTPIHLPAVDVEAALPGAWHGVASEAGHGTWAVLRRVTLPVR